MLIGFLIGAVIWWSAYVPGAGVLQNLQLLIGPAVFGVVIVSFRNWLKKVGPYDPETIEKNRRGRL